MSPATDRVPFTTIRRVSPFRRFAELSVALFRDPRFRKVPASDDLRDEREEYFQAWEVRQSVVSLCNRVEILDHSLELAAGAGDRYREATGQGSESVYMELLLAPHAVWIYSLFICHEVASLIQATGIRVDRRKHNNLAKVRAIRNKLIVHPQIGRIDMAHNSYRVPNDGPVWPQIGDTQASDPIVRGLAEEQYSEGLDWEAGRQKNEEELLSNTRAEGLADCDEAVARFRLFGIGEPSIEEALSELNALLCSFVESKAAALKALSCPVH